MNNSLLENNLEETLKVGAAKDVKLDFGEIQKQVVRFVIVSEMVQSVMYAIQWLVNVFVSHAILDIDAINVR